MVTIGSSFDDRHPAEPRMGRGVRHPAGLAGLALPARDEAISPAVPPIGDTIAAVPKFRRDAVIDHVPNHVDALSIFDKPEGIAAELEVIAALVNAVGP